MKAVKPLLYLSITTLLSCTQLTSNISTDGQDSSMVPAASPSKDSSSLIGAHLRFDRKDTGMVNFVHCYLTRRSGQLVRLAEVRTFRVSKIDSIMRTLTYGRQLQLMKAFDMLASSEAIHGSIVDQKIEDGKLVEQPIGDFNLGITGANFLSGEINIANGVTLDGETTGIAFSNCKILFICKDSAHNYLGHFYETRQELAKTAKAKHCKQIGIIFR